MTQHAPTREEVEALIDAYERRYGGGAVVSTIRALLERAEKAEAERGDAMNAEKLLEDVAKAIYEAGPRSQAEGLRKIPMTTTPIDPTKIRPGDKVTFLEAEVADALPNWNCLRVHFPSGDISLLSKKDIATHAPKPREFKPGDRVSLETGSTARIIAIDNDLAWIRFEKDGLRSVYNVGRLRHADDGDDR